MAPSFDQLSDHDLQEEGDEIDFSDLQQRYDVRLEEGLETFIVRLSGRHILTLEMLTTAGHRWPSRGQQRTKAQTREIPHEKTGLRRAHKRW
jgi:hypothetical protein